MLWKAQEVHRKFTGPVFLYVRSEYVTERGMTAAGGRMTTATVYDTLNLPYVYVGKLVNGRPTQVRT